MIQYLKDAGKLPSNLRKHTEIELYEIPGKCIFRGYEYECVCDVTIVIGDNGNFTITEAVIPVDSKVTQVLNFSIN